MQTIALGKSDLVSSRLVYGCMRIAGDKSASAREKGKAAICAAIEAGFTHFDHADIYTSGECERIFGEVLRDRPGMRESVIITSKCGIRFLGSPDADSPSRYDFSRKHILASVDGSLERLGIDTLDILLLHRPDYLMDPDEVAEAFATLRDSGKVRYFGVSNFSPSQVTMLQAACPMPLIMNQVEINIHNISALRDGVLDQCRTMGMAAQAWCPVGGVAYPAWGNTFTPEQETRIKKEFDAQAKRYGVENWIIALAWLLIHPAAILPIIGTTTPQRIRDAKKAIEIAYTREDWYRLLEARDGKPVP